MKPSIAMLLCLLMAVPAWAQPASESQPASSSAPADAAPEPEPTSSGSGEVSGSVSYSLGAASPAAGEPAEPGGPADGYGDGGAAFDEHAGRGIQIGALVGLGLSFKDNVGSVNPLGLGLGVMGGGHLDALYLGARAHFYVGGSSKLPTGQLSASGWLLAGEAGYDLDVGWVLTLRPGLLLGAAFFSQNGPLRSTRAGYVPGSQDWSHTRLYLAPGATLLLPGGRLSRDLRFVYAGVDLRVGMFLGSTSSAGLESSLILGVEL